MHRACAALRAHRLVDRIAAAADTGDPIVRPRGQMVAAYLCTAHALMAAACSSSRPAQCARDSIVGSPHRQRVRTSAASPGEKAIRGRYEWCATPEAVHNKWWVWRRPIRMRKAVLTWVQQSIWVQTRVEERGRRECARPVRDSFLPIVGSPHRQTVRTSAASTGGKAVVGRYELCAALKAVQNKWWVRGRPIHIREAVLT